MRNEALDTLGVCEWCERNAVVVHLSFAMCGVCFADASLVAREQVGFDDWIGGLPKEVAERILRAMLTRGR
ncbi:MAG TPA: hypothetical protein VLV78_07690 [Thermoanaerobaculia bacterium]|nr:hypothetical protein [Thermoanaerobaculia bacterium]